jgi:sec-independent protein translocase protein TatA
MARCAIRSSQRDDPYPLESHKGRINRGPCFCCFTIRRGGRSFGQVQKKFMNTMFAAFLGGWEWIIVLLAVLLLFGAKKIPELARGLGQGIKEFKKATKEVTDEIQNAPMDSTAQTGKLPSASPSQPASTIAQNPNPPKA